MISPDNPRHVCEIGRDWEQIANDLRREGVWTWDAGSGNLDANPDFFLLMGVPEPEGTASLSIITDHMHPAEIEIFALCLRQIAAGEEREFHCELRISNKGSAPKYVSMHAKGIRGNPDDARILVAGTIRDTVPVSGSNARLEPDAIFRSAMSVMHDGMVVQNRQGEIVTCNRRAEEILGLTFQQMAGRSSLDPRWYAIHANGQPFVGEAHPAAVVLREGKPVWNVTMGVHKPEGVLTWIRINADPIFQNDEAKPSFVVVTFADITEEKRLIAEQDAFMDEIILRADRDPLTNLLNHATFQHRLQTAAERLQYERSHHPTDTAHTVLSYDLVLVIAVMDMDNFKYFNDSFGHMVGDEVLCSVASALEEEFDTCLIARIGGDEFALFQQVPRSEVQNIQNRLKNLSQRLYYTSVAKGISIPLYFSVGVAVYPDEANTVNGALYLADKRALQNKAAPEGDAATRKQAEDLCSALSSEVEGFAVLDALVAAIDNKDHYTRVHSQDVMQYTGIIADNLGLSPSDKKRLQIAALLHDVGKIGVPYRLLSQPSPLSPAEAEIMCQHPVLGSMIVGLFPELFYTMEAIKHHHERWDGNGYPSGLKEEEIPLSARILAVADGFSAMTNNRPYRMRMTWDDAIQVLQQDRGRQWDSRCVAAFLKGLAT